MLNISRSKELYLLYLLKYSDIEIDFSETSNL